MTIEQKLPIQWIFMFMTCKCFFSQMFMEDVATYILYDLYFPHSWEYTWQHNPMKLNWPWLDLFIILKLWNQIKQHLDHFGKWIKNRGGKLRPDYWLEPVKHIISRGRGIRRSNRKVVGRKCEYHAYCINITLGSMENNTTISY